MRTNLHTNTMNLRRMESILVLYPCEWPLPVSHREVYISNRLLAIGILRLREDRLVLQSCELDLSNKLITAIEYTIFICNKSSYLLRI